MHFHHFEKDIGLLGSRGNRRAIFTVNCKRLLQDEEVYWCTVMAKELYFFLTKSKSDSCVRSKQVRFITIHFSRKVEHSTYTDRFALIPLFVGYVLSWTIEIPQDDLWCGVAKAALRRNYRPWHCWSPC